MLKRDRNRNFSATFTSSTFKSVCSAAGAFLFPVSMTPNIARDVGFFDLPQAGKEKKNKKKTFPGHLHYRETRGGARRAMYKCILRALVFLPTEIKPLGGTGIQLCCESVLSLKHEALKRET